MTDSTDTRIRRAMANSTKGETGRMTLPPWVRDLDLDAVDDVLGWRDPKAPDRGVLLLPGDEGDDGVVAIALRAGERAARATAMCALCRTTHAPGRVELLVARRAGAAGRNGDTVGTYVCGDLRCAQHVRVEKATAALRPTPGTSVEERREGLRERARRFVDAVLS
ncbi:FBP domain-containing protein [Pseudonocardia abyssalis]|uniref:FBP domain-containing protein n=1 Tax=Pseudonocardia abyssalis TaxID=2792008 RepID=A0ABS6UY90_9PSEU|nr:FBP domain-containing protein [Pseudonocardia abyssalis]MBW0114684.1 FBP domain-containing protein [Pseudonocardia abyssalis]MBW0136679.1 FBP domain-containing protein [Pseudonocardia abyssalis]